jgi:hypothetical protein
LRSGLGVGDGRGVVVSVGGWLHVRGRRAGGRKEGGARAWNLNLG